MNKKINLIIECIKKSLNYIVIAKIMILLYFIVEKIMGSVSSGELDIFVHAIYILWTMGFPLLAWFIRSNQFRHESGDNLLAFLCIFSFVYKFWNDGTGPYWLAKEKIEWQRNHDLAHKNTSSKT
jgi:hypothetical protein